MRNFSLLLLCFFLSIYSSLCFCPKAATLFPLTHFEFPQSLQIDPAIFGTASSSSIRTFPRSVSFSFQAFDLIFNTHLRLRDELFARDYTEQRFTIDAAGSFSWSFPSFGPVWFTLPLFPCVCFAFRNSCFFFIFFCFFDWKLLLCWFCDCFIFFPSFCFCRILILLVFLLLFWFHCIIVVFWARSNDPSPRSDSYFSTLIIITITSWRSGKKRLEEKEAAEEREEDEEVKRKVNEKKKLTGVVFSVFFLVVSALPSSLCLPLYDRWNLMNLFLSDWGVLYPDFCCSSWWCYWPWWFFLLFRWSRLFSFGVGSCWYPRGFCFCLCFFFGDHSFSFSPSHFLSPFLFSFLPFFFAFSSSSCLSLSLICLLYINNIIFFPSHTKWSRRHNHNKHHTKNQFSVLFTHLWLVWAFSFPLLHLSASFPFFLSFLLFAFCFASPFLLVCLVSRSFLPCFPLLSQDHNPSRSSLSVSSLFSCFLVFRCFSPVALFRSFSSSSSSKSFSPSASSAPVYPTILIVNDNNRFLQENNHPETSALSVFNAVQLIYNTTASVLSSSSCWKDRWVVVTMIMTNILCFLFLSFCCSVFFFLFDSLCLSPPSTYL